MKTQIYTIILIGLVGFVAFIVLILTKQQAARQDYSCALLVIGLFLKKREKDTN